MKKILSLILVLSMAILFLISCKGSAGPSGSSGPSGNNGMVEVALQNSATYNGETDTVIDAWEPTTNFGNLTFAPIGVNNNVSPTEVDRVLIYFNLTSIIPSNVTIQQANLVLYAVIGNSWELGTTTITAYAVTTAWSVSNATWNTPWISTGGDYSSIPISNTLVLTAANLTANQPVTFQISPSVVQGWISNPAANYGLLLKALNETTGTVNCAFNTSSNGNKTLDPVLTLYYNLP